MSKEDAADYIADIRNEVANLKKFTEGITFPEFKKDTMRIYACIRSFEIIGEAAKNVPEEYKKKHPEIEWKKMAGMRDVLIHSYSGVNLDVLWKTKEERIPILEKALAALETKG